MFLTRLARLATSLRSLRSDDRGVALAAVLAFMMAGILFSSIVAASVVFAYQFSSTTRAGVQAQAAAEAGIAAARAGLIAGDCVATGNGEYTSATAPEYNATIWLASGASWVRGCPVDVESDVRILSTGYASSLGVAGDDSRDTVNVEAILSSAAVPTTLAPSGPAIYAYDAAGFGGSGTLISLDGTNADVLLQQGDVTCNGNSSGAANFVVKTGNLTGTGACEIAGDVWVSGSVDLNGGAQIGGSITATSMSGAADLSGSIWVDGALTMTGGSVAGTVRSGTLTMTGGTVTGEVWVTGATTMTDGTINGYLNSGSFTVSQGALPGGMGIHGAFCLQNPNKVSVGAASVVKSITGTGGCKSKAASLSWAGWAKITTNSSYSAPVNAAPSKPSATTVPDWVDFGTKASHYTSATWSGFTIYTLGTTCGSTELTAALAAFGSNPGVIDARLCSGGFDVGNGTFNFQNDIAIIAKTITLKGNTLFQSSSATIHDMWLINPDTIANSKPDCSGQAIDIGGSFEVPNLNLMFYSPCALTISSGLDFRGQVFTNSSSISGDATFTYVQVGLPGYNLSTGLSTTVEYTEADRTIVSQRNVTEVP